MNITRRGILRMLPAAPFMAKHAQKEAEKLTGIGVAVDPEEAFIGGLDTRTASGSIRNILRIFGIPEWKKREIRRHARSSRTLDPDIAALQSISLSGKINMQWKRNESKQYSRLDHHGLANDEERDEFLRKHNLDWF